jgi:hypothetical protein
MTQSEITIYGPEWVVGGAEHEWLWLEEDVKYLLEEHGNHMK